MIVEIKKKPCSTFRTLFFFTALTLVDQNPWLSPDKYSDQFNGKNNNTDNNDNENTLTIIQKK